MKKILILTFCRTMNIGANLQAYALQEYISTKFNASVVHLEQGKLDTDIFGKVYCIKDLVKNIRRLFYYNRFKKKIDLYHEFEQQYIIYVDSTDLEMLSEKYDAFIVGSDQVWNCKRGINDKFYLTFVSDNKRKIAYAASIGLKDIPDEYKKIFNQYVSRFDFVSLREKASCELVEKYSSIKKVQHVLDPVFLLKRDEWENIMVPLNIKKPYILVYAMYIDGQLISCIKELKRKTGLPVYSIYRIPGLLVDKILEFEVGPLEFLGYISAAEYIVTSSFHCVAFSLIFEKKFISIPHGETGVRTIDLLNSVQYPNINDVADIDVWARNEINYSLVNRRIQKLREDSTNYLKNALDGI